VLVSRDGDERPSTPATTTTLTQPPAPRAGGSDTRGLVTGLTESNPNLLRTGDVPSAFAAARDRVVALKPKYFRLMVDWRRIQPRADMPPDWSSPSDGCLRGLPPCAESSGIRDVLRAVRERQRADGGWEVVATFYGTPEWALRGGAPGCGTDRRPNLDAYRALVRSLREFAQQEGIAIRWWSPWNEPNHPEFLGPQRTECSEDAEPLSPQEYANIALALQAELGPGDRLVLGEVAGFERPRARAVSSAEFARALPAALVCATDIWAQHAYVRPTDDVPATQPDGDPSLAGDPDVAGDPTLLRDVTAALDAHGCEREHRIWITETGVGGPRAGETRPDDAATDAAGCEAMDGALRAWAANPRVDAAFQYTFREDTAFPVGLADARLDRFYRAYDAWEAWSRPGAPPGAVACRR
jgi:hypothetical protein